MKLDFNSRVGLVLCSAILMAWADRSEADLIINPGFETGTFSGYTTSGSALVTTASFGDAPPQGIYDALLSNGAGAVSGSSLESSLGLSSGTLTGLGHGTVINGSALQQTFTVTAGSTFSFQWNFLTNEDTPSLFNDDFAFVNFTALNTLADTNFPIFNSSNTRFISETGFQTFSVKVTTTASYRFEVGVVNVGDTFGESALLVDNLTLTPSIAMPEPSVWITAGTGMIASLFGYGWHRLKRKHVYHLG